MATVLRATCTDQNSESLSTLAVPLLPKPDEGETDALKGGEFARLQRALQLSSDLIVDIGASNIEELLAGMEKSKGSHEDFDFFVVPTVADAKQLRDTANTVAKLASIGVVPARIRIVLNRVDNSTPIEDQFSTLVKFLADNPLCTFNEKCAITENEIYQLVKHDSRSIGDLAADTTDFKGLIVKAATTDEKIKLADQLAIKRLAAGVLPELDDCFKALALA